MQCQLSSQPSELTHKLEKSWSYLAKRVLSLAYKKLLLEKKTSFRNRTQHKTEDTAIFIIFNRGMMHMIQYNNSVWRILFTMQ